MISVVIPLYNKAGHIAHTLTSVIMQTYKPHEIIVIDDGSTDRGSKIVEQFFDAGVRLITQSNQGVSAARNRGLEESNAEFVAFLDADDYWLPNHLETLHRLTVRWPEASLASTAHYIKRDGEMYEARSTLPADWEGVVDNFFRFYAKGLSLVNSSTVCVNRRALMRKGGFPVGVRRGEDIIAWTRLALDGVVVHKAVHTAVYNQEADNRSARLQVQEPPGSLVYLAQLLKSQELKPDLADGISVLFDRIALLTAAGSQLDGDTAGVEGIAELVRETGRLRTAMMIGLVMLLPLGVLQLARKFRHRQMG